MPYCSSYAQMRCVNKVVKNGNFVKILEIFMHCQIFLSRVDKNGNHYCSLIMETEFVIHPLVCQSLFSATFFSLNSKVTKHYNKFIKFASSQNCRQLPKLKMVGQLPNLEMRFFFFFNAMVKKSPTSLAANIKGNLTYKTRDILTRQLHTQVQRRTVKLQ